MAAMVRASSGLQYPDRFYAAASYAGFDGSPKLSSKALRSKFSDEAALLLYGLYQQVLPRALTPVTYRCCFSLVECSVLALDESALDVDQVDNLIKFCPTKEEMELLKGYNGDKDNLGKCEQVC
ncbi:acyl-CoA-binding domain-containing protein 4 isoform X2 [Cucumis melo var. makuwa]|uniref:Acyl-CoA-binding domain-containing protein 4 isoform X2 n=1 Tax=Cucumis melo var. makuwa TaxID=1194695 RepID=A0A5A7SRV4_CUCMM|nr:acyl-CoA-binding domain-containing protein 4 isoform X2 [Cucumis melo var. makuwa]